MRDTGVDSVFELGGKLFVAQAKSANFKLPRERALLQRLYAVFKRSCDHGDIKASNLVILEYPECATPLFDWVVSSDSTAEANSSRSAKARALAKALSVTRVRRSVRVVTTACYLLKVLKRALKIIAALTQRPVAPAQEVIAKRHFLPFEHGWIKTHGPRPPRLQLKAAGVLLQQVHGRVHSPLAA